MLLALVNQDICLLKHFQILLKWKTSTYDHLHIIWVLLLNNLKSFSDIIGTLILFPQYPVVKYKLTRWFICMVFYLIRIERKRNRLLTIWEITDTNRIFIHDRHNTVRDPVHILFRPSRHFPAQSRTCIHLMLLRIIIKCIVA